MAHPLLWIVGGIAGLHLLRKKNPPYGGDCPAPTQDSALNKANKMTAVKKANYGPDPFGQGVGLAKVLDKIPFKGIGVLPLKAPAGHEGYWRAKARRERVSVAKAREQLCGNCAAFDVSPQMVACGGASDEAISVICSISGHPRVTKTVGYCRAWDFTCSAMRTCDSWVGGGPKEK